MKIDKQKRILEYKAKLMRKKERYAELAQKHSEKADSRYEAFKAIGDGIPMGQPILIGHHSERKHRADLKRMDNHMKKLGQHLEASKHYERKIESLENNRALFSNDPELLEKVSDRLTELIKLRDAYKAFNKTWKKYGLEKAMEEWPGDKEEMRKNIAVYESFSMRNKKLPGFMLTNLNAKIRRYQNKKEWAEKIETKAPEGFNVGNVQVKFEEGYWKVFFESIPSEETRSKLKRSPLVLKWSRNQMAWVRKHTESCNEWFKKNLIETIEGENKNAKLES